MDRKFFTALLLAVIVGGLVYLVYLVFEPFLLALLWATVLAIVTYPAYEQLVGLLRGHRTIAAGVMMVLVVCLIVGPVVTLLLYVVQDAVLLADDLSPEKVQADIQKVMEHPWVQWGVVNVRHFVGEDITAARITAVAKDSLLVLLQGAGNVVLFLFELFAGVAMTLLATFFLYRDGPAAVRAVRELIPMSDDDRNVILGDIKGAIDAAVRGGLLTAFVQGLLGYIILFILGVQREVLLAVMMAIASLIPIVGTAIVWVPLAAYLAVIEGQVAHGLVLAGYGAVVIGSADNFLRPLLVGRHMEAHPLILFLGTLGGIAEFGFPGIVLGPVVVALMSVATRMFRREFAGAGATAPSSGSPAPARAPPSPAP